MERRVLLFVVAAALYVACVTYYLRQQTHGVPSIFDDLRKRWVEIGREAKGIQQTSSRVRLRDEWISQDKQSLDAMMDELIDKENGEGNDKWIQTWTPDDDWSEYPLMVEGRLDEVTN